MVDITNQTLICICFINSSGYLNKHAKPNVTIAVVEVALRVKMDTKASFRTYLPNEYVWMTTAKQTIQANPK